MTAMQNELIQGKEKYKTNEEKIYRLLKQQEAMTEKWRTEHQSSVRYFEKVITDLNGQVKTLKKEYVCSVIIPGDRNATMTARIPFEEKTNTMARDKSAKI